MEQQAFYIVFAIIGMAIVGIVSWAATYSSRNDYDDHYRNPGGYPPPYYPPYPPHYPPPYPPQRGMSFGDVLSIILLAIFTILMMQHCDKRDATEQDEQSKDIQNESIVTDEVGGELTGEVGTGYPDGRSSLKPATDYEETSTIIAPVTAPPVPLSARYFFQKYASGDSDRILSEAQALNAISPGSIYIGVVDDGTCCPYKLLIGPYDTEAAAQSVHGRGRNIYRPADKGVQIYNPR